MGAWGSSGPAPTTSVLPRTQVLALAGEERGGVPEPSFPQGHPAAPEQVRLGQVRPGQVLLEGTS